jgi:hypothetical protein
MMNSCQLDVVVCDGTKVPTTLGDIDPPYAFRFHHKSKQPRADQCYDYCPTMLELEFTHLYLG